ncbi:glutaminase [Chrysiogenes arsenatis]|uniref:glutaminase n=1 Tax=Chrysiogenes arsenatis TaxID=309797 RepID=UPI00041450D8|nr:glutaminase [Chrysiogenes arsenatis]
MISWQPIIDDVAREVSPHIGKGKVAAYIPELARVDANHFGMALCTPDGRTYCAGDASIPFSIQSISKVFTLTLALQLVGDDVWKRLGREPSGSAFNSLVQLEQERGIPRNPFINAGAHVVTDIILSRLQDAKLKVLHFVRGLCNNSSVVFDLAVARSEQATGFRNYAMANFLKSFGNLNNSPDAVLDAYFHHCSMSMTCVDVARACLFLCNSGILPESGECVVSPALTKRLNALMLTCGTYDSVGDFAFRVGLPAKSGVGGGIIAVLPGHFSVCVWSPCLNESGNSLAGTAALELLTEKSGLSIF